MKKFDVHKRWDNSDYQCREDPRGWFSARHQSFSKRKGSIYALHLRFLSVGWSCDKKFIPPNIAVSFEVANSFGQSGNLLRQIRLAGCVKSVSKNQVLSRPGPNHFGVEYRIECWTLNSSRLDDELVYIVDDHS